MSLCDISLKRFLISTNFYKAIIYSKALGFFQKIFKFKSAQKFCFSSKMAFSDNFSRNYRVLPGLSHQKKSWGTFFNLKINDLLPPPKKKVSLSQCFTCKWVHRCVYIIIRSFPLLRAVTTRRPRLTPLRHILWVLRIYMPARSTSLNDRARQLFETDLILKKLESYNEFFFNFLNLIQ